MATVLNRTTRQLIASAHTPDYPSSEWIINPDLSAVLGQPTRYWVITGEAVSLMDQAQRDAVDAAELTAARDAIANQIDSLESILRALALIIQDEMNLHANRVTAILDAVDNAGTFAALKTAVAAIPDVPTRTPAQLKTALRNRLGT